MNDLEFNKIKKKIFDIVICSHLLEVAKDFDIKNNNTEKNECSTIEKIFSKIIKVLNNKKNLYLTTPNNMYYKSTKLDYFELKKSLEKNFKNYKLFFFNTFPRLNKKNMKMNLANVLPKLLSKILNLLLKKDKVTNKTSVSFYVEAIKDE